MDFEKLMLYAVIGTGSIGLVSLGALSGDESDLALDLLYLDFIRGAGLILYFTVLVVFAQLPWHKNGRGDEADPEGPRQSTPVKPELRLLAVGLFLGMVLFVLFKWTGAVTDYKKCRLGEGPCPAIEASKTASSKGIKVGARVF